MVDNTIFRNVVLAFITFGFLYVFLYSYFKKRKFYTRGIRVRAYVQDSEIVEKDSEHDFASEKNSPNSIPKILFTTLDGKSIEGLPLFYIRTKQTLKKGAITQVNYLPENPENFILSDPMSIYKSFSFTLFFIFVFGFILSGNYYAYGMEYFSGALTILSIIDLIIRRRQANKYPLN